MTTLFSILILASSLGVIVSVVMQEGSSEGMGAVGGGSPNLSGGFRGTSREDLLKKITIVSSIIFIISALVLAAK
jgi:preprotein translocase subunit SecG